VILVENLEIVPVRSLVLCEIVVLGIPSDCSIWWKQPSMTIADLQEFVPAQPHAGLEQGMMVRRTIQ
jgi:hypothetical protein